MVAFVCQTLRENESLSMLVAISEIAGSLCVRGRDDVRTVLASVEEVIEIPVYGRPS